jgi:hypothetical protein
MKSKSDIDYKVYQLYSSTTIPTQKTFKPEPYKNEGFVVSRSIGGFLTKRECTNTSHISIQYHILSLSIVITH